jgi:hypothetical protein
MPAPTSIRPPLPMPELLPISHTKPSSDGAFPFLVLRFAIAIPKHSRFEIEIASIQPTTIRTGWRRFGTEMARYSCEMNLWTVPEFQHGRSPTGRLCARNICSTVTAILSRPRLRCRTASGNAFLAGGTHRGRYRRTRAPWKINGAGCDRHEKCSGDSARTADNPREGAD